LLSLASTVTFGRWELRGDSPGAAQTAKPSPTATVTANPQRSVAASDDLLRARSVDLGEVEPGIPDNKAKAIQCP
jgi:hypothetical protein